ncbi:2-dehydropantoate 2-reductase N-terminal domain-containing protein [Microbacterium sp.]|uniref:2-dehydropantoate 2-reductase N-terminal domain-containing protein n=1 Tax=Microbacterium sp. TaxID=51671 RepID=UPI003A89361E
MSTIHVVGAGVVGSATGKGLATHGHDVTFVDTNETARSRVRAQGFAACAPQDQSLDGVDAVFVAVTALTGDHGVDLTHLMNATESLGQKLRRTESHPLFVYRCTMPPGTMRDTIIPRLEQVSQRSVERDFGVVYNPEYLRAATAEEDFLNPRLVTLSTVDKHNQSHKFANHLLSDLPARQMWLPLEVAEFHKYVNNVGNAVTISFFNLMRRIGENTGLDGSSIDRAFEATVASAEFRWNSRYGTRDLGAYGGACLPKDTLALTHYADQIGIDTHILRAVMDFNEGYRTERPSVEDLEQHAAQDIPA